jgi:D-alanyl-D-alanine dipeptidase
MLVTSAPASADVPPVSPQAHAAGLIDVRTVVPDARIDLRYATADNFVGIQLYPADARCLVHESLAPGLTTAAAQLRERGLRLVFWDCYRPHEVQVRMFEAVSNPNWVAKPSEFARSHESGRSVDVTLADGHYGWLLGMGTGFDDFTPRSLAYATDGVSTEQQANRALLREAMSAGGLTVYSGEWWHFDGPGAGQPRPTLDVPLT